LPDHNTIRVYDDRAADYAEMTDAEDSSHPELLAFIAACPTGGRVLDLGCGPGTAAAVMARAGLQVEATDASSEMVAMAARHPGVNAQQAVFDDIDELDTYLIAAGFTDLSHSYGTGKGLSGKMADYVAVTAHG